MTQMQNYITTVMMIINTEKKLKARSGSTIFLKFGDLKLKLSEACNIKYSANYCEQFKVRLYAL